MLKKLATIGCCAAGLCLSQHTQVDAQQPLREGVRRTGQAVAEGTRAAVRGTAEAARRTGQATRNAIRGESQTQLRTEAMTDTNPTYEGVPTQNPNTGVTDTETSIQGNNPQQQQYLNSQQQPYESGYRGTEVEQQSAMQSSNSYNDGRVYTLRHDSQGREFICVSGRRVYFDSANTNALENGAQSYNSQAPAAPTPYRANRPMSDGQMIPPAVGQDTSDTYRDSATPSEPADKISDDNNSLHSSEQSSIESGNSNVEQSTSLDNDVKENSARNADELKGEVDESEQE